MQYFISSVHIRCITVGIGVLKCGKFYFKTSYFDRKARVHVGCPAWLQANISAFDSPTTVSCASCKICLVHNFWMQSDGIQSDVKFEGYTSKCNVCLPCQKGSSLKRKNVPFRVDTISGGLVCRKANRKSPNLSPFVKMVEIQPP